MLFYIMYGILGIIGLIMLCALTFLLVFIVDLGFHIVLCSTFISLVLWTMVLWNSIFVDTFYTIIFGIGCLLSFSAMGILLTVMNIPYHRRS